MRRILHGQVIHLLNQLAAIEEWHYLSLFCMVVYPGATHITIEKEDEDVVDWTVSGPAGPLTANLEALCSYLNQLPAKTHRTPYVPRDFVDLYGKNKNRQVRDNPYSEISNRKVRSALCQSGFFDELSLATLTFDFTTRPTFTPIRLLLTADGIFEEEQDTHD